MYLMPFQILWMWLRGLLSLALLGAGIYLLTYWYTYEPVREVTVTTHDHAGNEGRTEYQFTRHTDRADRNFQMALLLGGLALSVWSLGGGWIVVALLRRHGPDDPRADRGGAVQRLRRPDGTELHVEVYGPADAPPMILTHGWGLNHEEWYYVKKSLAQSHRLIVWDLPGLGHSGRPANNDWSLEKLAGDLEAVLSLANGQPAVLLGHSIGGMITLTFCRLFPEALGSRVSGLVLVNTTYINPVKTTKFAALHTALQKPLLEPMAHAMIWLAPLAWAMNWLSYLNGSAHRSTEKGSFSGHETWGQLDFLTLRYACASPAVIGHGFLGMFRYDATAVLPTISVPTLIVTADQDTACLPEASAYMGRTIPGARVIAFRPARHCGAFEHHEEFNAELERFASSCAAAARQLAHA